MIVNKPIKYKFSNPFRSYWEGGHICGYNDVISQDAKKVNKAAGSADFSAMVFPDRSRGILTKRNVAGLRR